MTAALPISRALRQNDRKSPTNLAIASSTSAAVAVTGTPAIASRAVSENSTACGANRCREDVGSRSSCRYCP